MVVVHTIRCSFTSSFRESSEIRCFVILAPFTSATHWKRSQPIALTNLYTEIQFRSQRPRSFWLATGIATSSQVQLRKSVIHGLPVTLRMLRVKSDKSDWFWSQSIVFTKPFKTGMSLDLAKGPDFSSAWQKGSLRTRLREIERNVR